MLFHREWRGMMAKKYKLAIIGSRNISDDKILEKAIAFHKIDLKEVSEIVSGGARGVDTLSKWLSERHNIILKEFLPDWKDLETPPVFIKENQYGKYNAIAGLSRNKKICEYADKMLAIWDGESKGTEFSIETMQNLNKPVMVYEL